MNSRQKLKKNAFLMETNTRGRANSIQKRYLWTEKFFKTEKKLLNGFKQKWIRVNGTSKESKRTFLDVSWGAGVETGTLKKVLNNFYVNHI